MACKVDYSTLFKSKVLTYCNESLKPIRDEEAGKVEFINEHGVIAFNTWENTECVECLKKKRTKVSSKGRY